MTPTDPREIAPSWWVERKNPTRMAFGLPVWRRGRLAPAGVVRRYHLLLAALIRLQPEADRVWTDRWAQALEMPHAVWHRLSGRPAPGSSGERSDVWRPLRAFFRSRGRAGFRAFVNEFVHRHVETGGARGDRWDQFLGVHETVCHLVRDVFPLPTLAPAANPFTGPEPLDPFWRTATVAQLAAVAWESRDFSGLPILADALQDAGCDRPDVLDHLRGSGPHCRGCWVLFDLLGLESEPPRLTSL